MFVVLDGGWGVVLLFMGEGFVGFALVDGGVLCGAPVVELVAPDGVVGEVD